MIILINNRWNVPSVGKQINFGVGTSWLAIAARRQACSADERYHELQTARVETQLHLNPATDAASTCNLLSRYRMPKLPASSPARGVEVW